MGIVIDYFLQGVSYVVVGGLGSPTKWLDAGYRWQPKIGRNRLG